MPYQEQNWVDGTTPLDAAHMGHMEAGIKQASDHAADTQNPHQVTKTQVGLGNVDNTSDLNKPVSTAQQAAIDASPHLTIDAEGYICVNYGSGRDITID